MYERKRVFQFGYNWKGYERSYLTWNNTQSVLKDSVGDERAQKGETAP